MDGENRWDTCLPGLKRSVNTESGILISHTAYGTQPYNGSKNCFLTITVPLDYRIRFKILDFDVFGDLKHCEKDTLHVFDHEQPIDPEKLENLPVKDRTPGSIIGQFCGKLNEPENTNMFTKKLAESTHNSLTLWWHTDANATNRERLQRGEGFRLLWSSFRVLSKREKCRNETEFKCLNNECIPIGLGCNAYEDCFDGSDSDRRLQIAHHCEHIPGDIFSRLTGPKKLLICMVIVLSIGVGCFLCLFMFFHFCWQSKNTKTSSTQPNNVKPTFVPNKNRAIASDTEINTNNRLLLLGQCNAQKTNPPPPKFLPPQAPVSPNRQPFQPNRNESLSTHHHNQKFSKAYPCATNTGQIAESSSGIASTSSSSHNNQTFSSLNTTTTGGQRSTGISSSGAALVPPISYNSQKRNDHESNHRNSQVKSPKMNNSPFIQQQRKMENKTVRISAPAKKLNSSNEAETDYTYVQNEQRHLLL